MNNLNVLEEKEKFTPCGRYKKKAMGTNLICNYLGLSEEDKKNGLYRKAVIKEFEELQKKYSNQDVDFALKKDLKNNRVYNYKVIGTYRFLCAFTL